MSVCLTCPSCGSQCTALWALRYCQGCWYIACGGDLASDEDLAALPLVTISAAPMTSGYRAWWAT